MKFLDGLNGYLYGRYVENKIARTEMVVIFLCGSLFVGMMGGALFLTAAIYEVSLVWWAVFLLWLIFALLGGNFIYWYENRRLQ